MVRKKKKIKKKMVIRANDAIFYMSDMRLKRLVNEDEFIALSGKTCE